MGAVQAPDGGELMEASRRRRDRTVLSSGVLGPQLAGERGEDRLGRGEGRVAHGRGVPILLGPDACGVGHQAQPLEPSPVETITPLDE